MKKAAIFIFLILPVVVVGAQLPAVFSKQQSNAARDQLEINGTKAQQ